MKKMARLITFFRQNSERKQLVGEAVAELLCSYALVRVFPFRSYAARLGVAHKGELRDDSLSDLELPEDVRWAVKAVSQTFGDRFTCLMQAMAAKRILNRRGVSNSLVLGAKLRGEEQEVGGDEMAAHAWLWAGGKIILGAEARQGFIPVVSYRSGRTDS